ncbi:MAG: Plug domain-containing protein [Chitinophagaceae bacterium]|nr:Plug domain-containing protein [Chitinophagaceae bacterium]
MKKLFLSAFFMGVVAVVFAQKEKKFNDTAYLQPLEVVAVRAFENAPFAKTDLTKKDIAENNLGQDLPFILNQTPSVVVSSDAGNGVGYTGIRIRGTDAARINVTLNGIPYNDAESQGTFFVDLPDFASSSNSIQIQRGVGTSSNGAGFWRHHQYCYQRVEQRFLCCYQQIVLAPSILLKQYPVWNRFTW